jgi:hypothetical protein
MTSTYLVVPSSTAPRVAHGYSLALARATVSASGQVASIAVTNPGGSYSAPPQAQITGGGGTGAAAIAILDAKGGVGSISVQKGGSGYIAPPTLAFNGGNPTEAATAEVIISNGRVVGVKVLNGGSGYSEVPSVTISGGRRPGIGRDATATAHIANGHVEFVGVDDSGDGYKQPIAVVIAPGEPLHSTIPIWAPAGALSSTVGDMAYFAAAALGHRNVAGRKVPPAITDSFKIAETAYACTKGKPNLAQCGPGILRSGLAWAIEPADPTNGVPAVISKNGGLPGFSTQVYLMPDRNLAVVVFVNTRQGGADTGEQEKGPTKPAPSSRETSFSRCFTGSNPAGFLQPLNALIGAFSRSTASPAKAPSTYKCEAPHLVRGTKWRQDWARSDAYLGNSA